MVRYESSSTVNVYHLTVYMLEKLVEHQPAAARSSRNVKCSDPSQLRKMFILSSSK